MKNYFIILLIFMFSNYSVWSQNENTYTVSAPNGLVVRSAPSIKSERKGKLPPGEYIELIKDTKKSLSVKDKGINIKGSWFKVRRMNHSWDKKPALTGYVFSGYLLKNESRPYNPSDAITNNKTILNFKNFDINFYFYETSIDINTISAIEKDTMHIYEEVFNNLADRLIHIKPKVKVDKVELFYTFKEKIWEYENNPKKYTWEGFGQFKKLPLKRNLAMFPKIAYEKIETSRQVNLKLRDTMVHYPGEMGGTRATISYKGRPCVYFISDAILKIILHHSNGFKEIKYIIINLSYGC